MHSFLYNLIYHCIKINYNIYNFIFCRTSKSKATLLPTISKRDSVKEKNGQEKNDDDTNNINLAMTVTSIFPNQNYVASSEKPLDYPNERTNIQSKISNCIEKLYSGNSELQKIAEDISHVSSV